MRVYFLTGASGAVGSAIVPLLLADPQTQVRLLLRADSDQALERRLVDLLQFWAWPDEPHKRDRIKTLRGDAVLPDFGLGKSVRSELLSECSHIIHCAGAVRMNLPLDEARRAAIGSTREVLALARQLTANGQLRKVEFVSTVGVAGKRPGSLPETWLEEPRLFHNTYEQAKSEAEEIVRIAVDQEGLPITVHRPSMVIGDSGNGRVLHFQIFYFICEFLSGRKTFGIYPSFDDVRLDIIPANWVADAIVAMSREPETAGKVFNLCTGPELAPRLEDLKEVVRQAFREHGLAVPRSITLPRSWFTTITRLATRLAPASQRKALETLPVYLDYLADRQGFSNRDYVDWLETRGKTLPLPEDYLPTVLSYYLDRR